jgi:hypothetical protein
VVARDAILDLQFWTHAMTVASTRSGEPRDRSRNFVQLFFTQVPGGGEPAARVMR